ncbi:hypothetical protein B0H17DRAFT_1191451 [Mycena rosella]|uniref:Uncharacterized protein n=1 Tax=Mycena rosella TaxID=1033263 RepID=A0AAD7GZQ7_MYCRO|nr:hypothetical protein B0H17DRAFT_1191451 [Mycena rosella]
MDLVEVLQLNGAKPSATTAATETAATMAKHIDASKETTASVPAQSAHGVESAVVRDILYDLLCLYVPSPANEEEPAPL